MSDVKWIKFYVSILTNPKIKRIRRMPGGNTIALIWAYLLAQAGESNKDGAIYFTDEIPYSADEFALQYDFEIDTVRLAVATFENFGMIGVYDGIIYIKNWEKYQSVDGLEKIKEQNRIRQAKFREKQKFIESNVMSNDEVTHGNGTDKEIEIDIDKELNKDINNKYVCSFEELWNIYPRKKEKAKASKCYQSRLKEGYSETELLQAAENYAADCKKNKTEEKYIKLCATFLGPSTPFTDYIKVGEVNGSVRKDNGTNDKSKSDYEFMQYLTEEQLNADVSDLFK